MPTDTTSTTSIVCAFTKEKDTKNTVRFSEDGDPATHKVGSLYIKKDAAAKLGERIVVTIDPA